MAEIMTVAGVLLGVVYLVTLVGILRALGADRG